MLKNLRGARETLIRQHIYAESDKGLFRQGHGMDTVARSRGLSEQFIRSVLQGYCFYEPPHKLSGYVEENKDRYPVSLTAFWTDSGELVLGRAVFTPGANVAGANMAGAGGARGGGTGTASAGAGRVGSGSGSGSGESGAGPGGSGSGGPGDGGSEASGAFFTHQLVVSPAKAAELVPDMMNLLYSTDFRSSYANKAETNLPELANLHFDMEGCRLDGGDDALLKYGLNASVFGAMLDAVMIAVREGRRVYIVPNVRTGRLYDTARCILKYLISSLPYSYRNKLGFTTYSKDRLQLPGVSVYFMERDYASYARASELGEFVFDFANNALWAPPKRAAESADAIYLNSAWENRKLPKKPFFEFAAAAAGKAPANIETLNALSAFWLISEKNRLETYRSHRLFVQSALVQSAGRRNAALSPIIKDVFAKALEQEGADMGAQSGYLTEPAVMSQIAQFAENAKENDTDGRVVAFCADSVVAARGADKIGYINEVFALLMSRPRIFRKLQARLNDVMGGALDGVLFNYALTRLASISSSAKLIEEIEFWWANNPNVLRDGEVVSAFGNRARRIFSATRDKAAEGARFHARMEYLLRNVGAKDDKRLIFEFARALLESIDRIVLDSLAGDSVTLESLQAMKIDSDALKSEERFKTLEAMKGFVCSDSQYVMDKSLKTLQSQGQRAYQRSSGIILRLLAPKISSDNYDKIVSMFTDGDEKVRFGEIFEYINENKNKGESCNFVKWAFRNDAFYGPNYADFNNAVVEFFSQFTPKEFKMVLKNFAYLYSSDNISDSEKNLRHILDVFKKKNALIPKPSFTKDFKGIGTIAVVALSIVVGIVLIVTLISTVFR
jgi:hypothetical protein